MDFKKLLSLAETNKEKATQQASVKRYSSVSEKPAPTVKPKPKEIKSAVSSNVILGFLKRKENEQKKKAVDAFRRKEELLALRSAAKGHTRTANAMARRTKDNNFALNFDQPASDQEDGFAETDVGEEKPKRRRRRKFEGDPNSNPIDDNPKSVIGDGNKRKHVIDASVQRKPMVDVAREANVKRKPTVDVTRDATKNISRRDDSGRHNNNAYKQQQSTGSSSPAKPTPSSRPRTTAPQNFHDLLKLANSKQYEPIVVTKVVKKHDRPMTAEEKQRSVEEDMRRAGKSVNSLPKTRVIRDGVVPKKVPGVLESTDYIVPPPPSLTAFSIPKRKVDPQTDSAGGFRKPMSKPEPLPRTLGLKRSKSVAQSKMVGVPPPKMQTVPSANKLERVPSKSENVNGLKPSSGRYPEPSRLKPKDSGSVKITNLPRSSSQKASSSSSSRTERSTSLSSRSIGHEPKMPESVSKHKSPSSSTIQNPKTPESASRHKSLPSSSSTIKDDFKKHASRDTKVQAADRSIRSAERVSHNPISAADKRPNQSSSKCASSRDLPNNNRPNNDAIKSNNSVIARKPTLVPQSPKSGPKLNKVEPMRSSKGIPSTNNAVTSRDRLQPSKEQIRPRDFPPKDLARFQRSIPQKHRLSPRSPSDVLRRKPNVPMKRRIESDEEDEEMDDFIDDGPIEGYNEEYTRLMAEITGNYRRRYMFESDDDDVGNMESSFVEQMKEEAYSARMGLQEDLEDIRKEEEANKRRTKTTKRRKL